MEENKLNRLKEILSVPSYSRDETRMISYLTNILTEKGYEYTFEKLNEIANDYSIKINANFILETTLFEKEQLDYQKEISRLRDKIENEDVDSIVQCTKCKSYNVSYIRAERQRGGDEAEITKYTCNNIGCGHSWKN
jgi:DNA-directed RNA polymerase subunit M/transcription elongation factor TFIIS